MATKKKMQAGGTTKSTGKAPDKKGDYITVQKRTLGNMKRGGKLKKSQVGSKISQSIPYTDESGKKASSSYGLENAKIKSKSSDKKYVSKMRTDASGNVTSSKARRTVKGFLTGAPRVKDNLKKGGKVISKKK